VNRWLEPVQRYLDARSPRENWLIVASIGAVVVFAVHNLLLAPLAERQQAALVRREQLDSDLLKARRLAAEIRRTQGGIAAVEAQLAAGSHADLGALLEQLAGSAAIRQDQLESVKPIPVSGSSKYPETRVQVSVRGASMAQTVRFLHAIETSDSHLILRSLQIRKGRSSGDTSTLDVTLAVSSFSSTGGGARPGA
jgi:type II secretory pathway component PulM